MKIIKLLQKKWALTTMLAFVVALNEAILPLQGAIAGHQSTSANESLSRSGDVLFAASSAGIEGAETHWLGLGSEAISYWLVGILVGMVGWIFFRHRGGALKYSNRSSSFSALAEKSDNAILVLNEAGRIEWINGGFTKVTGIVPKDATGKLPGSLLAGGNESGNVTQSIREGLATKRNFSLEFQSRHAHGHTHWLSLNFTPVFCDRNALSHFVVVANDITARKRAEEALSRASRNNELILNAMNEGVCGMDFEGAITFINSSATRMTGWKMSDLIGTPVSKLLYQLKTDGMPDIESDHFLRVAFGDGKVLVGDSDQFLKNNGNHFPVCYTTTPIYEGEQLIGSVMVFRDISEQKQSEIFRARQGKQFALRAEVGFALATGDSQKSFLQACSHSFLKALGATCCRIWVYDPGDNDLKLEASAGLDSGSSDSVKSIPLGTMKVGIIARDRVASVSNDLLHDPDEIDKEWIKAEGLTSFVGLPLLLEGQLLAVIGVYSRSLFSSDTIDLLNSVTDSIGQGVLRKRAERRAVEQSKVLDKVSEAIILMDLSGRIEFWNDKARQLYGWTSIEVVGQLIEKLVLNNHNEFLRLKKEAVAHKDWKTKCIHRAQNRESVEVNARWSTFLDADGRPKSLCLMVAAESESQGLDATENTFHEELDTIDAVDLDMFDGHGECILLVDDEPEALEQARSLLCDRGYKVITAADGIEAVSTYSRNRKEIALVLTDLSMPHMDGIATTRTFKQLNSKLPILVVCNPDDPIELKDSAKRENVDLHEKPLTAAKLLPCLRVALTHKRDGQEADADSQAA